MLIDKRALEILEDLPLRPYDAWYVLLVYLGLKSGAWVDIKSNIWREGDAAKSVPQSTRRVIEESLDALGLVYHVEERETDAGLWQPDDGAARKRLNQIVDFYIAKEQTILDDIIRARKQGDHKLLGLSLGYPKTAVEAFGTDRKILVSKLDPKVRLSEVGQLTYFALSKDHWKDELAIVEAWIAALKDTSEIMWHQLRSDEHVVDEKFVEIAIKSRE